MGIGDFDAVIAMTEHKDSKLADHYSNIFNADICPISSAFNKRLI